jgi:hypothetical protein
VLIKNDKSRPITIFLNDDANKVIISLLFFNCNTFYFTRTRYMTAFLIFFASTIIWTSSFYHLRHADYTTTHQSKWWPRTCAYSNKILHIISLLIQCLLLNRIDLPSCIINPLLTDWVDCTKVNKRHPINNKIENLMDFISKR